jgi:peptide/nickel transport system permease protein
MSTPETAASTRQLLWQRRRATAAGTWRSFRRNRQAMVGLTVLVVMGLIAVIAPHVVDPAELDPSTAPGPPVHPPTWGYPLGTDNYGRSVLSLLLVGSRISLVVGLTATVGAVLIGATMGVVAGFYSGGWVDRTLNALTDWFLVIPWLVLAIALASVLGPSLLTIVIVIAVTSWPTTARLVRSQTLSIRQLPYVERARVLGATDMTIMGRHILPNVFPVIFANAVLTVAIAILSETTLSILGLGDPNSVSWGRIIEEAFNGGAMVNNYWWWLLPPGIAIVLVTLAFTMCGYALDEILNPKLRGH